MRVRAGETPGGNLMVHKGERHDWSRVLVVLFPCCQTFLERVAIPDHPKVMPGRFASSKAAPVSVADAMMIPGLCRSAGGFFLAVFLLLGWLYAARTRVSTEG